MAVQEQTLENLLILNNIFVGDDVIGKKMYFQQMYLFQKILKT